MKRFLPGFAKQIPLLLNQQAECAIKHLNFARAIERMKLSMRLCNYAMADTCADLLFHGRTGIEKNRYDAVEIADAGDMAGNELCGCLIRIFSFEIEKEFKRREDTKVSTSQVVVKSPEHLRLERSITYQQSSLKPYLNPYVYLRSPLIIDESCACGYCVTLKAELFPEQHGADCLTFAKSGYASAQYIYGRYIQFYTTIPHRLEIVKYWYLKSALNGYPKAIYQIARNMFFGIGSDADFVSKEEFFIAYKLFQYAKYAGHEECDRVQGCDWFLKACRNHLT
jgi:TPR repeat protein